MAHTPIEIANALLTAGETDAALEILNNHLDSDPDDAEGRRLRAGLLLRMAQRGSGSYQAALADLDRITAPTTEDHRTRSLIYEAMGDLEAAVAAAYAARDASSRNAREAERIVKLLMQAERWEEALSVIAEMQQVHDDWRWSQWAGDVASAMGDDPAALAHYQAALDALGQTAGSNLYKEGVRAHISIKVAKLYYRFGQFAQADSAYEAASSVLVHDPVLRYHQCLIQVLLQKPEALSVGRAVIAQATPALREEMRQIDPNVYAIFTELKG